MNALTFTPEFLTKFDSLEPLGAGGMGTVYRGIQRSLERPVAIKFLSRQLLDEEYLARFRAEARLAGQVFHTNLVAVIEFGMMGDVPFIVFELVEGASLREHVKRGSVPLAEALAIVHQVADGLAVAHGIGIIHRDIKPENILVGAKGVKVADFGVAKNASASSQQTRSGMIMGTPAYMAPEQAREQAITPATDVYALGVVLYELVSGRLPFQKASTLELLQAIVGELPPALPERVPAPVVDLVMRMLAKDPAARPATMADCARELARVAESTRDAPGPILVTNSANQGHATVPTPRPERARVDYRTQLSAPQVPQNRTGAIAAVGLAVVLLAVAWGSYVHYAPPHAAPVRPPAARPDPPWQRGPIRAAYGVAASVHELPPEPEEDDFAGRGGLLARAGAMAKQAEFRRQTQIPHDQAMRDYCASARDSRDCNVWHLLERHDLVGAGRLLADLPGIAKAAMQSMGHGVDTAVRATRINERLMSELFLKPRAEGIKDADELVKLAPPGPVGSMVAGLRDLLSGGPELQTAYPHLAAMLAAMKTGGERRGGRGPGPGAGRGGTHVMAALAYAVVLPVGWADNGLLRPTAETSLQECEAYLTSWQQGEFRPVAVELIIGLSEALGRAPAVSTDLAALTPELRARVGPRLLALTAIARAHLAAGKTGSTLAPDPEY